VARDQAGSEEITRDISNLSGASSHGWTIPASSTSAPRRRPATSWSQGHAEGETQLTPEEKLLRAIFGEKPPT